MRRHRKAKIVATLGPASSTPEVIEQLFLSGADVFRLNFSHGTHEDHKKTHTILRDLEQKLGKPISILLDLQGPKLRVGVFENDKIILKKDQTFQLDLNPELGNDDRVYLPHPELYAALQPGHRLLLDDGRRVLEVKEVSPQHIITRVIVGGVLSNRKGVNVPDVMLPISALTEKDLKDLTFGLSLGVDWIALSFVQRPEDIIEAKKLIQGQASIIAKLEKPLAIDHLEAILEEADGVMVARGDLGVELPPERVPILQKQIIRAALKTGKPVIVATQMLDSMVQSPSPTRAEASDVATAIYDGVDAVMLSAESASGAYPVEAVSMMNRIIHQVEVDPTYRTGLDGHRYAAGAKTQEAITLAARHVADAIEAPVIAAFTVSGSTALSAARERPKAPILCITPQITTARKLVLAWGIHAVHCNESTDISNIVSVATKLAQQEKFVEINDRIVITAGVPFGSKGKTSMIRITCVGEETS